MDVLGPKLSKRPKRLYVVGMCNDVFLAFLVVVQCSKKMALWCHPKTTRRVSAFFLQQFCDLHADMGVGLELCIFYSWTWMPFNWDELHDVYKSEYGSFDQH